MLRPTPTLLGPGVAARLQGQAVQLAVLQIERDAAADRMADRAEKRTASIQRRRMETTHRLPMPAGD